MLLCLSLKRSLVFVIGLRIVTLYFQLTYIPFCSKSRNVIRRPIFFYVGDFNFPNIDWEWLLTTGPNEAGQFLDMCLNYNFTQVIDQPTRGGNILDLVLTACPDLVKSVSYVKGLGDHNLLHTELSFPTITKNPTSKTIREYKRANYVAINENLGSFFETYA